MPPHQHEWQLSGGFCRSLARPLESYPQQSQAEVLAYWPISTSDPMQLDWILYAASFPRSRNRH